MKTYVVLKLEELADQYETDADRRILCASQNEDECLKVILENEEKKPDCFLWELYECEGSKITKINTNYRVDQTEED